MKYLHPLFASWLLVLSAGCGSAEAIKRYNYPVTKDKLEEALQQVIHTNPHIVIDTTPPTVLVRQRPDNPKDTSAVLINLSDFHSKDSASVASYYNSVIRIKIEVGEIRNNYSFRYLGDEQHWKSSKTSAIFIETATDKSGNHIEQGKNEKGQFNSKLAEGFTSLFEKEVVSKIDKELHLTHTSD